MFFLFSEYQCNRNIYVVLIFAPMLLFTLVFTRNGEPANFQQSNYFVMLGLEILSCVLKSLVGRHCLALFGYLFKWTRCKKPELHSDE